MDQDIVRQLASQPPPAHRLWRFNTARSAQARINELETQLVLPQSPLDYNITVANSRIRALEAMVQKIEAAKSAALAPTAAAAPALSALHGRERFIAAAKAGEHKPSKTVFSHLKGRDRFMAAAAVDNSKKI